MSRQARNDVLLITSIIKELAESRLTTSSVELEHEYELIGIRNYPMVNFDFYELEWCNASTASKQDILVDVRVVLVGKAIQVKPVVDYDHFNRATANCLEVAANKLLKNKVLNAITGDV
jgi:hypothetical protein